MNLEEHRQRLREMTNNAHGPKPSKGLGDTVSKVTKAMGIKECGGCKRRRERLNKLVPYGKETSSESSGS